MADNPLEITRVADDPATPEDETAMYAVTQNAIEVKGIKGTGVDKTYDEAYFKAHEDAFMNPDGAHRAYDAEATSYDVGIARPVEFTGVAFRDDKLADGTDLEPDFIDGLLDHQSDPSNPAVAATSNTEMRLGRIVVSVHRYDPETKTFSDDPVIDTEGNPAVMETDASGEFAFRLQPGYRYCLRAENKVTARLIKPTPYLQTKDPLEQPGADGVWDNDLYLVKGRGETYPFDGAVPLDAQGHAV